MIFKDSEQLTNIYSKMLTEAKEPCCPCTVGKKCTNDDCTCKACKKSKQVDESKKKSNAKPDYLDVDEDGDKKEPMKKALKDKEVKESSRFKSLFLKVINEQKVCGCTIKRGAQYKCMVEVDGEPAVKKTLSGESVLKMKDNPKVFTFKSVKAAD